MPARAPTVLLVAGFLVTGQLPPAASGLGSAGAAPLPPQGDRRVICENARIPDGWVHVGYEGMGPDCPPGRPAKVIQRYDRLRPGTELTICPYARVPSGWGVVAISFGGCMHPTAFGSPPSTVVRNLGSRAREAVCSSAAVPAGWVVVDYHDALACAPPGQRPPLGFVIERHDNKRVGAQMRICQYQPVPAGWRAVGTDSGPECLSPNAPPQRVMVIRRVR